MLRPQNEYTPSILGLQGPLRQCKAHKYTQVIMANGLLVGSGTEFEALCHFDQEEKLLQFLSLFRNEAYQHIYDYSYDEKGRCLEVSFKVADGTLIERFINQYDHKDQQVCTTIFNREGGEKGSYNRSFDDRGNSIQVHQVWINDSETKTDYQYNELGQEVGYFAVGKSEKTTFVVRVNRRFNERGLVSQEESEQVNYEDDVEVYTYAVKLDYEYLQFDHHHNWVRRLTHRNGVPRGLVERAFTYYE